MLRLPESAQEGKEFVGNIYLRTCIPYEGLAVFLLCSMLSATSSYAADTEVALHSCVEEWTSPFLCVCCMPFLQVLEEHNDYAGLSSTTARNLAKALCSAFSKVKNLLPTTYGAK